MSNAPQLFRVSPESQQTHHLDEVEFAALGFQERRDIQEWVAANPRILGGDLLIVGKEFSGFDRTNERLDLLAVDSTGALVIIELKRDDSGADAHWQAIKYASYLREATVDTIVRMRAAYAGVPKNEAEEHLQLHIGAEELSGLNHDQRIILASHRFAPEVTSAALWLNDKVPGKPLITCVTLTPYRDPKTQVLYVQSSAIIPVPTKDEYTINVESNAIISVAVAQGNNIGEKISRTNEQRRNDLVSQFCRKVADIVSLHLPPEVRPDKRNPWARGSADSRSFEIWYARRPWGAVHGAKYDLTLIALGDSGEYSIAVVFFAAGRRMEQAVVTAAERRKLPLKEETFVKDAPRYIVAQRESALTDDCAEWAASELRRAITIITPVVDALPEEGNEAEV